MHWTNRAELFPEAPIVFTALQVPAAPILTAGAGVTGIRVSNAHAETLKLALDLHPSVRQAFIVAHSANERSVEVVRKELSRFAPRVKLTYINEGSVPNLLAAVRAVPPTSLLMFLWHAQDEPGNIKYSDEFARLVAHRPRHRSMARMTCISGVGSWAASCAKHPKQPHERRKSPCRF